MALIGALTYMGRAILDCLADRGFSSDCVSVFDFQKNIDMQIPFGCDLIRVQPWDNIEVTDVIFLCEPSLLADYKNELLNQSEYLIDCTGLMSEAVPVIAHLNMKDILNKGMHAVANPTCLTILLAEVLTGIQKKMHIQSLDITGLLSASEFGTDAVECLMNQSRSLYTRENLTEGHFPKTQAFNLIPEVAPILAYKTVNQVKTLLKCPVTVSTCLTPIFQGQACSVTLILDDKCSLSQLEGLFKNNHIKLVTELNPYITVTTQDVVYQNTVYVTHLRRIPYLNSAFHFWAVCDGLYSASALNAVQIAEYLLS